MSLTFFDACAGIGGFRLGMEAAGHTCVGSAEIDKFARKAYAAIHGAPPTFSDIRQVNPDDVPDFDVLCAGFPCQAFSVAGHRGGFEDTRGTIIFELLRIAEAKRPAYLLFENVKNLLFHDEGRTFGIILSALDALGYDAEWQVLDSRNFHVPQHRERCYLIGHSRGRRTRGVLPIIRPGTGKTPDQLSPVQMRDLGVPEWMVKLADRQAGGGHVEVHTPDGVTRALRSATGGGKVPCVVLKENGVLREVGDYSLTIGANYWKGWDNHGGRSGVFDGARVRRLTPRECWRLQGIPDEAFDRASKVVSKTQLYRLAGNAVSVPVVYEIAKLLEVA